MQRLLLFYFSMVMVLAGCDEDLLRAPGTPEPHFIAKFYNADSLMTISALLVENEARKSDIDSALQVVNDSINNGNTDPIYQELKELLIVSSDSNAVINKELTYTSGAIQEGRVVISKVVSSINKEILGAEDSVDRMVLPLNMAAGTAGYDIYLLGADGKELKNKITLEYALLKEIRNNYYVIRASDIQYNSLQTDYDSVKIICNRPDSICNSNETLVELYF